MSAWLVKSSLVVTLSIGALASAVALVACASSDDEAASDDDAGNNVVPVEDAGEPDVAIDADADAPSTCSPGGWCHTELPADVTLTGVWGDGTGVVWAVSKQGQVLRWDGSAWKLHASGLGSLRAIWGSSPADLWLSSEAGLVHGTGASSDSIVFTDVTAPGDPSAVITSIWGAGPDDVWAVGGTSGFAPYAGRVLHYGGAAAGWTVEDVTTEPIAFTHVWGSSTSGVWLGGHFFSDEEFFDEGVVLRRAPSGTAFTPVALPVSPTDARERLGRIGGVSVVNGSTVLVVGKSTYETTSSWHATSSDNGKTFAWSLRRERGQMYAMSGAFGSAANDAWMAGEYGRVWHWDGTEWTQSAVSISKLPITRDFHAMWGQPSKELWVVGDRLAVKRELSK